MQSLLTLAQNNLVLLLTVVLIAVTSFTLGLLTRRRHVIQILPAPVSDGLERAISAALSSRELVYVQQLPSAVVEPAIVKTAKPADAMPVSAAVGAQGNATREALSSPEEIVHEIEKLADKIAHEAATALDAAARDALLAILDHMEHHSDDAWFDAMHDKLAHAHSNADLAACAKEMIAHLHH